MRRLLEWLDLNQILSGAAHVAVGLCGLGVVSAALLGSIAATQPALSSNAAAARFAGPAMSGGQAARLRFAAADAQASIEVPAVFRQTDARNALLRNVVATDVPTVSINLSDLEKERRCLTEGIYFEARSEGVVGQLAVAEVILNRVVSGRYPASICGVVFQGQASKRCQFSFACNGDMKKRREPVAWRKAQRLAHYVLAGKVRNSIVGPATFYHATYVSPYWAQSMVEVVKVGQHIFYRSAEAGDGSNPS